MPSHAHHGPRCKSTSKIATTHPPTARSQFKDALDISRALIYLTIDISNSEDDFDYSASDISDDELDSLDSLEQQRHREPFFRRDHNVFSF